MATSSSPATRRRPPPRPVEVVAVSRLTPRLVSVTVGGPGLAGFAVPVPTAHIKVFLPAEGESAPNLPELGPDGLEWRADAARPVVRTYTPRRFDASANVLDILFVIHGEGPASAWADRAAVGDQLGVAGPGGRFSVDPDARRWWIGGDEAALPAILTLLDALPEGAEGEVHVEVAGAEDEMPVDSPPGLTVRWHHRLGGDQPGQRVEEALAGSALDAETHGWVAGEATSVRRLRKQFQAAGLAPSSMTTRGYWRAGSSNHPDHDYGDES